MILVLNYLTAHRILYKKAKMHTGETALVHDAGGGIGTALLQLSQRLNLKMYGTASKNKWAVVEALGAMPIDYREEDF